MGNFGNIGVYVCVMRIPFGLQWEFKYTWGKRFETTFCTTKNRFNAEIPHSDPLRIIVLQVTESELLNHLTPPRVRIIIIMQPTIGINNTGARPL